MPWKQDFGNPPHAAQPAAYYLMLNGYLNRAHARRELEELAAKGIRGLCVFDMGGRGPESALPPAGPPFLSDAWLDQFAVVLEKARDLGMTVQLAFLNVLMRCRDRIPRFQVGLHVHC